MLFVQFSFAALKHALWFAAAIDNMQFLGMEGDLTHIQTM